jgi:putative membrane protein
VNYFWIKSLHLLFAMAWVAALFYLPRFLINLKETEGTEAIQQRLQLMAHRLYRFGHVMFGLMLLFGLALWFHFKIQGPWLHAKLTIVALLLGYFIGTGVWLKRVAEGRALPSTRTLKLFNEIPVLLLLAVIYLVIAKPF